MKNIIKYIPGEHSWVTWIKKRIKNNLNFIGLAEGETGIGKSWSMISIAYAIDKNFEPRQVAFSFKQIMEIITSDWFDKKEWKVIVFDEAQCDISNRAWQSLTNKLMNYLLSTFRHRNVILLFTSPYIDFLDSQTMKLIHCKFEIRGHSRKTNKTHIRPKLLQYNSKLKKFYEHSLFVIRGGKVNKLVHWYIVKPPKHLIDPYEIDKLKFTDRLNKDILKELEGLEGDKETKQKSKDLKKELNPESMQPDIWEIVQHGYSTQQEIADKLGKKYNKRVDISQLSGNIMSMRKKGWDIRQFKKK